MSDLSDVSDRPQLTSEVEIHASASRVWSILTETDRYHEWNPFIREVGGLFTPGTAVTLHLADPDGEPTRIEATVTRLAPLSAIELTCRWPDETTPRLEHGLVVEPTRTGTRFSQRCAARDAAGSGPLDERTRIGLGLMNAALKSRAER